MDSSIAHSPFRRFIREWLPPGIRTFGNRLLGALTIYRGPYADWSQAENATGGYQHTDILTRVRRSTEQVLRGDAIYEQDGVAMHGEPPASPALQALLLIAALDGGRLSVLDFGGGLGSHFLRWRPWLSTIPNLHWCVVEQPHFVAAGADVLAHEQLLSFATSIDGARVHAPNAVLASSVLQYLPDPQAAIGELVELGPRGFVLDRTPLSARAESIILSQHVPKSLGRASYPLWLLPREIAYARLHDRYTMLAEFSTEDVPLRVGQILGDYVGSVWLRTM